MLPVRLCALASGACRLWWWMDTFSRAAPMARWTRPLCGQQLLEGPRSGWMIQQPSRKMTLAFEKDDIPPQGVDLEAGADASQPHVIEADELTVSPAPRQSGKTDGFCCGSC